MLRRKKPTVNDVNAVVALIVVGLVTGEVEIDGHDRDHGKDVVDELGHEVDQGTGGGEGESSAFKLLF